MKDASLRFVHERDQRGVDPRSGGLLMFFESSCACHDPTNSRFRRTIRPEIVHMQLRKQRLSTRRVTRIGAPSCVRLAWPT